MPLNFAVNSKLLKKIVLKRNFAGYRSFLRCSAKKRPKANSATDIEKKNIITKNKTKKTSRKLALTLNTGII